LTPAFFYPEKKVFSGTVKPAGRKRKFSDARRRAFPRGGPVQRARLLVPFSRRFL
jgi:hypothetical protein